MALSVLTVGGLISFQAGDGLLMGPFGLLVATALYAVLGMAAYLLAAGIAGLGLKALLGREVELEIAEALGFSAATLAGCVLLHITFPEYRVAGYTAGGLTGELVGEIFLGLFEVVGTYLVALALLVVGLIASTPLSARHLVRGGRLVVRGAVATANYLWGIGVGCVDALRNPPAADEDEVDEDEVDEDEVDEDEETESAEEEEEEAEEAEEAIVPKRRRRRAKPAAEPAADASAEEATEEAKPKRSRKRAKPEIVDANAPAVEPGEAAPAAAVAEPEAAEAETEAETDEGPANERPRRNRKRKAMPEIVIADPAKADEAEASEASEASEADEDAGDEGPSAEAPRKSGKKAPPRPHELASRSGDPEADADADADADEADEAATPAAASATPAPPAERVKPIPGIVRLTPGAYKLPPAKLFEAASTPTVDVDKGFVLEQAEKIEQALAQFKIRGQVTKIHPGPVITRYEFKPEPGVKLSKIESLENDLAMALEAIRIRILAPIPGKSTVGFEVPNKSREVVSIQEILESDYFGASRSAKLPMALGKNITGKPVSIDLAKAPHLLVAGATGSGKSVGVNSMICSL
ncbi:MAG: DNA translocase FtsK 4TM domain-containing protein, partial [Myxococcales bacterium]|nr:DNA translocase FtsK 4TM domain-containing protein [Myxococcales bacterium]